MFATIKRAFQHKELRGRIIYTLGMLFVYKIGASITIPAINSNVLKAGLGTDSIFGLMNLLGGGSLEQFSLFALGVSPYITASIVIELLSMDVIPYLSELKNDGDVGRKKKDRITRYTAVILGFVQAFSTTYALDSRYGLLTNSSIWSYLYVGVVMVAGTMFAIWMGDQITNKGIGNGVSLIIFTGIVSSLPNSFIQTARAFITIEGVGLSTTMVGVLQYILFVVVYLLIVVFVVYNEGSVRKIPINYASSSNPMMRTKDTTHIPLKINSAGVIPVIFASSIMATVLTAISFMKSNSTTEMIKKIFTYTEPIGFCIYVLLIVLFSFFYSNLQIDANKISKDLKKSNGSIPGVRQGIETEKYISKVLNRITVFGSIFLLIVATIPVVIPHIWKTVDLAAVSLGGTGLIIVTGVALETVKQINTYLTRKEYRGYIRK